MKKINKGKLFILMLAILSIAVTSPAALAESGNPESQPGVDLQAVSAGTVAAKEETVYGTLLADGKAARVYIVNILDVSEKGLIYDYGDYSAVKNLTNLATIMNQGGVTTMTADAGKFYYQGQLAAANLPWDFTIRYILDGREIPAADLAGKSGQLDIKIGTTMNAAAAPIFYENYMLQISVTLDAGRCANIAADGAIMANSGKNKLISFTVMPNSDGLFLVSTAMEDFQMAGITISALPFSMAIDLPDTSGLAGQTTKLADAIAQLDNGIADLDAGIRSLRSGADLLKKGSAAYKSGIASLNTNSSELIAASKAIQEALKRISASLAAGLDPSGLSSLALLPQALDDFAAGISGLSGGLAELKSGFATANDALRFAISAIPAPIAESDLQALYAANAGSEAFQQLMAQYEAAQTVKATYAAVKPAFAAVGTTLDTAIVSLNTISASLDTLSSQLAASLDSMDIYKSLSDLSAGISALSAQYSAFNAGLVSFGDGVRQLSSKYVELHAGFSSLAGALGDLSAGTSELASGSSELSGQTRDLTADLQTAIDELLGNYDHSDFVPVSFVSAQNQNVTGVQFVLITEEIKLPQAPVQVPETKAETIWSRLMDLFE
jgi:X-X-X-Leu-X-X-Gly heptad repeat protein